MRAKGKNWRNFTTPLCAR